MKVILVAKNEFAAYFVNSADFSSMKYIGFPCRTNGRYKLSITFLARSSRVPITTRSGFMKSLTANPSLKNSGFETTAKSTWVFLAITA